MPFAWVERPDQKKAAPERSGASLHFDPELLAEVHLWPHRSLPKRGFVIFIGTTAGFLAMPLLALIGTAALWGVLPFILVTLAGVWWGLARSYRDVERSETLRLWPDKVELTRHDRGQMPRCWQANPYWVSVHLHPTGGPVPYYLTLRGNDREVEIGAFLSAEERTDLAKSLRAVFASARQPRDLP